MLKELLRTMRIERINKKIDRLIIAGKRGSKEYKELCKQHKKLRDAQ